MASSIKLKDTTKKELEKLQAKLLLEFNTKLNQQEIIELLVLHGKENIELMLKSNKSVGKSIYDKLENGISSWNIETDAEIIDDILYGENHE